MLNEQGWEIPDDTPVAVPARLSLPTNRAQQIQAYIRQELSQQAADNGEETFEEANDLDVDEFDQFGMTPYEIFGEVGNPEAPLTEPPAEAAPVPKDQAPAEPEAPPADQVST